MLLLRSKQLALWASLTASVYFAYLSVYSFSSAFGEIFYHYIDFSFYASDFYSLIVLVVCHLPPLIFCFYFEAINFVRILLRSGGNWHIAFGFGHEVKQPLNLYLNLVCCHLSVSGPVYSRLVALSQFTKLGFVIWLLKMNAQTAP